MGIPNIESQSIEVTTDAVIFSFNPHSQINAFFQGLIAVKLSQSIPTGTTATLPIKFATIGIPNSVKQLRGHETDVTAGDIAGRGIYLCFYDRASDTLQLLTTAL